MEFWFIAAVASGLLSWGHLISSDIVTWLHRYLNWTELDDDITEFNNEMPLTLSVVSLKYSRGPPEWVFLGTFILECFPLLFPWQRVMIVTWYTAATIGCLQTCDFDDAWNAAGGQEVIFLHRNQ